MNEAGIEIDFLQVGDGERSGDAIALRYGSLHTGYEVMVIDDGNKTSGEALVQHDRTDYGTSTVQHVVNGHPDGDHSSGLSVVLDDLDVRHLWMHQPWNYARAILDRFRNPRLSAAGLEDRVRDALDTAHDLEVIAGARRIPIHEPFQGATIGPFLVLSPEKDWYLRHLVPNFDRTPDAKTLAPGILTQFFKATEEAVSWVAETFDIETLDESGETSAQNESSVVLYGNFGGRGMLLTGDAGRVALTRAILYAQSLGISLQGLDCVQIPHHGSRRNVSPSVLNHITGRCAIVSVAPGSTTHPRRKVTNAFRRRGARVHRTNGGLINFTINWPRRPDISDAPEIPFYDRVEG